jgi:hypothetical protein
MAIKLRRSDIFFERKSNAGVGHDPIMPLLTELENYFWRLFYKYAAPTALSELVRKFLPTDPSLKSFPPKGIGTLISHLVSWRISH